MNSLQSENITNGTESSNGNTNLLNENTKKPTNTNPTNVNSTSNSDIRIKQTVVNPPSNSSAADATETKSFRVVRARKSSGRRGSVLTLNTSAMFFSPWTAWRTCSSDCRTSRYR